MSGGIGRAEGAVPTQSGPTGVHVSIIIPTFQRPSALQRTLAALADVDFPGDRHEVIVVDDGSDEATRLVAERAKAASTAEIRYVAQSNSGVATARNHGAHVARGELLIFLDDDMIVERDHVQRHLAVRARYGDCLVNGDWDFSPEVKEALAATPFGRFRIEVEDWVKSGIEKRPLDEDRVMPSAVTACNLSIERCRFWELGGFDEGFPFAGFEDYEFSHRAKLAGCSFVYDAGIRLQHNDNRLSLERFCERQRRGAHTAVYLASKHPLEYASQPLILENAPLSRHDPPRVLLKKLVKRSLSIRPMLAAARGVIALLERVRPDGRLLRRAYWGMCGLYIYRGVQEGFRTGPRLDRHLGPPSSR